MAREASTSLVAVVLSRWESLIPPGQDTNPLQVSSQQTVVLIYLSRMDGKLSLALVEKKVHTYSNLDRATIELGILWSVGRDLTNCTNKARLVSEDSSKLVFSLIHSNMQLLYTFLQPEQFCLD